MKLKNTFIALVTSLFMIVSGASAKSIPHHFVWGDNIINFNNVTMTSCEYGKVTIKTSKKHYSINLDGATCAEFNNKYLACGRAYSIDALHAVEEICFYHSVEI